MNSALHAFIDGIAFWSPSLPGWAQAAPVLRGEAVAATGAPAARRPSPELLPPAERRRAPDAVALALEVATHAVAQSGPRADELLSVFTSAHGDLAVTDAICRTLVDAPRAMSPTRFHNSVHNAASGYWGIATGCQRASTALSGFDASFAAGLLEALVQCATEHTPVLLVGCDTEATGALASTNDSRGLLGVALVLVPERGPRTQAALRAQMHAGPAAAGPQASLDPARAAHGGAAAGAPAGNPIDALRANAIADALPLFEALAHARPATLLMPLPGGSALRVALEP